MDVESWTLRAARIGSVKYWLGLMKKTEVAPGTANNTLNIALVGVRGFEPPAPSSRS